MHDGFVGDVGDFGKYGLLRFLGRPSEKGDALKVGVVWYRSTGREIGKFVRYLEPTTRNVRRFQRLDEELYCALADLVHSNSRCIEAVESVGIFPKETPFYGNPLDYAATAPTERLAWRDAWLGGAVKKMRGCDIVFLDPDNGFAPHGTEPREMKAVKYAFLSEVRPYLALGQTVIVYHHLHRQSKGGEQILGRLRWLREELQLPQTSALWYHRGTARAFFVLPSKRSGTEVGRRLELFLGSGWTELGHFSLFANGG